MRSLHLGPKIRLLGFCQVHSNLHISFHQLESLDRLTTAQLLHYQSFFLFGVGMDNSSGGNALCT